MQSKDGGWGAFDADNTSTLVTKLPFCDFGEVIDPPSADVTAHTVEALAAEGLAGSRAVRRGVAWLLRAQESDGSWFGRWGANYVYGTGAVVPALIAAGRQARQAGHPPGRGAGWSATRTRTAAGARTCAPTTTPGWAGRGESTASQTAWALLALLAAGGPDGGRRRARRRAGWRETPARRTGPGTSRSSPGPASPATSTSTTTCTGWCSRSARWAATWRGVGD